MKVCIDSDSTGNDLKLKLVQFMRGNGFDTTDLNPDPLNVVQYPDVGRGLAKRIQAGEFERGIVICGTGTGVAIAANKVRGVFAGTCHDIGSAQRLAANNNAQILALGCETTTTLLAKRMVQAFLVTEFLPKRNASRLREIDATHE